ncbi:hypothetical protein F2P79_018006 [Pimephales promelas]|nr:hypothetical protein F2P79_018006 [Pimephales promelas]
MCFDYQLLNAKTRKNAYPLPRIEESLVMSGDQCLHLQRLEMVLSRFQQKGWKSKLIKCHFFKKEVQFLGHRVSSEGVATDPEKISAVENWRRPQDVTKGGKATKQGTAFATPRGCPASGSGIASWKKTAFCVDVPLLLIHCIWQGNGYPLINETNALDGDARSSRELERGGALLVLAVENEATTMITSTEANTALSMSIDNTTILNETSVDILNNLTTSFPPNSTVILSSTTDVNMSDYKSDLPTDPSENPQTNNDTTGDPQENVPTPSTKEMKSTTIKTTTTQPQKNEQSHGAIIYCCLQKKSRKFSVDLHPKQEDAQIPLSTVDVEVFDTTLDKDMQTFTPVESTEPLKNLETVKEAEKPEEGKESVDVNQENQQTQAKVPKDKTEEMTVVDISDVEPTISTKTSMESLDDVLNENNSNDTSAKDI